MKVLLAAGSYGDPFDETAEAVRSLARGLGELGHEVRIVTASPKNGAPYVERDGRTEVHRTRSVGLAGGRIPLLPDRAVRELTDGFDPDVVHGYGRSPVCQAARRAVRRRGIPYVATYHVAPETAAERLGPLRRLLPDVVGRIRKRDMRFLERAAFVTTPSRTAVGHLESQGLSVPHRAVADGVDVRQFSPGPKPKPLMQKYGLPDKPTVLYCGRTGAGKGTDVWLDAAVRIRRELDAHFLIGGPANGLPRLKRRAAALGIARHATFIEDIPRDKRAAFCRLGDVFATGAAHELQSLATLEAMATALPVVAADAAALPELVESGRNGYLFLPGSADGMAQSVVRILQNPAMARQMGAESRKIAERRHDARDVPKRYEAVYKEAMGTAA